MELARKTEQAGLMQTPLAVTKSPTLAKVYENMTKPKIKDYLSGNITEAVQLGPGAPVEYSGESLARVKLGMILTLCFEAIGVRAESLPTDASKKIIGNFILRVYPYLALEEILDAFLYAIEGRYIVDLELYARPVSVDYINRVIVAYLQWKKPEAEKVTKLLEAAKENPLTDYLKTRPLNDAAIKKILIESFVEIAAGNLNPAILLPECYEYLKEVDLISLTPDELAVIKQRAAEKLKIEEKEERANFRRVIEYSENDRARKLAVIKQFHKLAETGAFNEFDLIETFENVCFISMKEHRKLYDLLNNGNRV